MILYIIATPIGNLEDLSFRALRILKEVDLILCEDTRTTKKLLEHYQINKSVLSYHQHSKLTKSEYILKELKSGKNLALVSEAGTPGISDPGAKLVDYLIKEIPDLKIIPIPGACAAITALSASGLPADKFIFMGFPPIKNKRWRFFQEIAMAKHTVVFYESPHRIIKTLKELDVILRERSDRRIPALPDASRGRSRECEILSPHTREIPRYARNDNGRIVVCRELTKKFETIYRGTVEEIIKKLEDNKEVKGEFVVIFSKNHHE